MLQVTVIQQLIQLANEPNIQITGTEFLALTS